MHICFFFALEVYGEMAEYLRLTKSPGAILNITFFVMAQQGGGQESGILNRQERF
jgi:hypothetical protein